MAIKTSSVRQVCEFLGISRPTLYKLVNTGKLVKHESAVGRGKGGQRVYFKKDEVERLSRHVVDFDDN